ncbi:hypothetical protein AC1031_019305 [Aphanomyces cochlioides]|nr:hypothetical protein AC1031_019305 [Aphanomyces cochlioides]
MDSTSPLPPPAPTIATPHASVTALESLIHWLKTCMSSVLEASDCLQVISDSDICHELDVMLAVLQDATTAEDDLSRAQALAVNAYGDAAQDMAAYLQSIHESHLEAQKRWFSSVFSSTHEQLGLFRALVHRIQTRGSLLLRVLAIPQPPQAPKAPTTVDANVAGKGPAASVEDMPIESTFIKLQKKYIQEMARQETFDDKRHKRRRTLASFHSPSTKLS